MTNVVTITHCNEGIRIRWNDATVEIFSNAVQLAEAFARTKTARDAARKCLVEDAAASLTRAEQQIAALDGQDSVVQTLEQLRKHVAAAVQQLA